MQLGIVGLGRMGANLTRRLTRDGHQVADLLEPGDIVIDGGNSYYRDDLARAASLGERKLHHVDVGTSGGVFGLERGFCLMIGGEDEVVAHLDPIFCSLAPGVEAADRTPGRKGAPDSAEHGYLHCGAGRGGPLREDGSTTALSTG